MPVATLLAAGSLLLAATAWVWLWSVLRSA